jgi:hypothetical protein
LQNLSRSLLPKRNRYSIDLFLNPLLKAQKKTKRWTSSGDLARSFRSTYSNNSENEQRKPRDKSISGRQQVWTGKKTALHNRRSGDRTAHSVQVKTVVELESE